MTTLLLYAAGILGLLGAVVVIHEAGHFAAARLFRVGVLDFSFGFGRSLASFRSGSGVVYNWRALPLGGFVRLLDRTDQDLKADEAQAANGRFYQDASLAQRIVILLAGPAANFVLAFGIAWLVLTLGAPAVRPVIGDVEAGSIAWQAGVRPGDEVVQVGSRDIESLEGVLLGLAARIGESGQLPVQVRRGGLSGPLQLRMDLRGWDSAAAERDLMASLGLTPQVLIIPARVGGVVEGSPAERAQLREGDLVRQLDGVPVRHWGHMSRLLAARPGEEVAVVLERDGVPMQVRVRLDDAETEGGGRRGVMGIRAAVPPLDESLRLTVTHPWYAAWIPALRDTYELMALTVVGIYKLVAGVISPKQLAGPIGVAQIAGEAANISLYAFLRAVAIISVSIGIINLLPLPPLDGGRIAIHLVEMARRKEVGTSWQARINAAGTALLLVLFALVITLDLVRLLS